MADSQSAYREAVSAEETSRLAAEKARSLHETAVSELQALKATLKEHAPAASELNELLHAYLGHKQITIKVTDEGYNICRGNKVITKPLSEGEKTATAFCYFLASLASDGKKISELIVVNSRDFGI